MNELEKQIADLIIGSEIGREQKERIAKQISKFFLEEIKEAYTFGMIHGTDPYDKRDTSIALNSYLKSKYKI